MVGSIDGVYLVTGGAGAIGRVVARVLAERGARVLLADLAGERLDSVARDLEVPAIAADLADDDGAERALAAAVQLGGGLDGVIHTVGGFAMAGVEDSGVELYRRMFDLNVRPLICTVRAALPVLRRSGRGMLGALAAAPAWRGGGAGMSVYAAAKAAVAGYLRAVDEELAGSEIAVAIVYPMGAVDTPANRTAMPHVDPEALVDPVALAETFLFAATRSPRGRVMELPVWPHRAGG